MATIVRAVATIEAPSRPRHGRMTTSAATFVEHMHDEQQQRGHPDGPIHRFAHPSLGGSRIGELRGAPPHEVDGSMFRRGSSTLRGDPYGDQSSHSAAGDRVDSVVEPEATFPSLSLIHI